MSIMDRCKSCGANLRWIKTKNGKYMPCDAEPIMFAEGGASIYITEEGSVVRGTECEKDSDGAKVGYISHFATCPNAGKHRKRK